MTVRATERPNQLINDLITLRDAERVICRMSREEIMTRMKLGLFDGNSDQYYVADYEDTLEEHSLYAEILLSVRPCEEGVELVFTAADSKRDNRDVCVDKALSLWYNEYIAVRRRSPCRRRAKLCPDPRTLRGGLPI